MKNIKRRIEKLVNYLNKIRYQTTMIPPALECIVLRRTLDLEVGAKVEFWTCLQYLVASVSLLIRKHEWLEFNDVKI